jgi:hypothetical protein
VEDKFNKTSIIICTYEYLQKVFPKVELLEETKGRRKEEKNYGE